MVAGFFLLPAVLPSDFSSHPAMVTLLSAGINFGGEAVLTPRLVRKKYRSFRLYAVREDGARSRRLSFGEMMHVWLWIAAPQIALVTALWLLRSVSIGGHRLSPDVQRSISSLAVWLRFLWVGPSGIALAVQAPYPRFKLQGFGVRH